MIRFSETILMKEGMHARPASQLVKICSQAQSEVKIFKGSEEANPKSILGLLSLGASYQDVIEVEVSGPDEATVATQIKAFFAGA